MRPGRILVLVVRLMTGCSPAASPAASPPSLPAPTPTWTEQQLYGAQQPARLLRTTGLYTNASLAYTTGLSLTAGTPIIVQHRLGAWVRISGSTLPTVPDAWVRLLDVDLSATQLRAIPVRPLSRLMILDEVMQPGTTSMTYTAVLLNTGVEPITDIEVYLDLYDGATKRLLSSTPPIPLDPFSARESRPLQLVVPIPPPPGWIYQLQLRFTS